MNIIMLDEMSVVQTPFTFNQVCDALELRAVRSLEWIKERIREDGLVSVDFGDGAAHEFRGNEVNHSAFRRRRERFHGTYYARVTCKVMIG